jgi:hypothetical protein
MSCGDRAAGNDDDALFNYVDSFAGRQRGRVSRIRGRSAVGGRRNARKRQ